MARFVIESIVPISGEVYVLARLIDEGAVQVTAGNMLGGVPIQEYLSQPRCVDDRGEPRLDLFSFLLRHERDASRLSVGSEVELTGTSAA